MKALIFEGKVADLVETQFEVHPSMTWVDATDDTEVGGTWDGTSFGLEIPELTLKKLKTLGKGCVKDVIFTLLPNWWTVSDRTMTDEEREQALRDLPANTTNPSNVVWPT